jgi:hypothetical protein
MPNGRRIANETQAHVPQRLTPTGWLPGRLKAALRAELENLRTENKMMRLACVLSKEQPIRDGAVEEVMTRIKSAFVAEEGKLVPIDASTPSSPGVLLSYWLRARVHQRGTADPTGNIDSPESDQRPWRTAGHQAQREEDR